MSYTVCSPDFTSTFTEIVTSPSSFAVITASNPSVSTVAAVPSTVHVTLLISPASTAPLFDVTETAIPAVSPIAISDGADSISAFTIISPFFTTLRSASFVTSNTLPSTVTFTAAITFVSPAATPITVAFFASSAFFWIEATPVSFTDQSTAVTSPALTVTSAAVCDSALIVSSCKTTLTTGSFTSGVAD